MNTLTALLAALGGFFLTSKASAQEAPQASADDWRTVYETEDAEQGAARSGDAQASATANVYDDEDAYQGAYMADEPIVQAGIEAATANLAAFLATIRRYESADNADGYRMLYGGELWAGSMADHPYKLGWPGVRLPDNICRGAGFDPGCITTAAGAYQFLSSTWAGIGMDDFSPESQDAAAIVLIDQAGALADVKAGNIREALRKTRRIWASMPDAGYGQREHSALAWMDTYFAKGGKIT